MHETIKLRIIIIELLCACVDNLHYWLFFRHSIKLFTDWKQHNTAIWAQLTAQKQFAKAYGFHSSFFFSKQKNTLCILCVRFHSSVIELYDSAYFVSVRNICLFVCLCVFWIYAPINQFMWSMRFCKKLSQAIFFFLCLGEWMRMIDTLRGFFGVNRNYSCVQSSSIEN